MAYGGVLELCGLGIRFAFVECAVSDKDCSCPCDHIEPCNLCEKIPCSREWLFAKGVVMGILLATILFGLTR